MGYANIPLAIGWSYGSLRGGIIYDQMGDKANLAIRYMGERLNITEAIPRTDAFQRLCTAVNMNASDATTLLWNTYHPYQLWYQFAAIGFASAIGIFFYSRWVRKYEAADI